MELGEEIAAKKSEITEVATRRQRQRNQASKFAQRTGIAVPERALESLQADEARFLADFLEGKETQ